MPVKTKIISLLLLVVFAAAPVASWTSGKTCPTKKTAKKTCCVVANSFSNRAFSIKRASGCCCKISTESPGQPPVTNALTANTDAGKERTTELATGRVEFSQGYDVERAALTLQLHSHLKFLSDTKRYKAFESYLI